jgi:tRNA A-37 threonylcarbamoyl transferase component Bud32
MTEETIFLAALEKATPAERAAYLDAACAGDPGLRARVEALLRSHASPDSFLNRPAIERQAEVEAEPNPTTDLPAGHESVADEPAARDEPFAFLAPGGAPGALGRLDHYDVLDVIGRGGMGVVFKARDTRLQRIVAIKVLAAELAASGSARQRFFREARAAAAVRDDHVVSIHAVSEETGPTPYLVMEFIAGVTLEKRIKERGALAVKEVLRIGMQAAEGLAAAHRQGLIHRDVKPANILLENGVERVKITDFGLARAADDASLSQSGVIAGTPLYMSPEQARGETLDPRSDLFSLGSVLYTLCTGRAAFAAGNTMAVLKRVCEETPRPIREFNPDIPEWLAAVVDRLLAKESGKRFQTAAELAAVLGEQLAQLQQSRLTPAPVPEKQEAAPPPAAPAEPGGRAPWKRKRLAASLLAAGVVACLVSVAVLSRRWSAPSPGQPPGLDDPRVLTVSKRPEDRARFDTIRAALDAVEPGMTIRVLDDAVYEEHLLIGARRHREVVLEAAGKATIRMPPGESEAVLIGDVSNFSLRDFHVESGPAPPPHAMVLINGLCPGLVLDGLDMTDNEKGDCISSLSSSAEGTTEAPIRIQNCTFRRAWAAFGLQGCDRNDLGRPLPSGHVVFTNNTMIRCVQAVVLPGGIHHVLVAGNRILDSQYAAIDLFDPIPPASYLLIVNNTLVRNRNAMRIWDDHKKGRDFLKCKNIRVQNNLVLGHQFAADLVFFNHPRGDFDQTSASDLPALLTSPNWRFSHNWREIVPLKPGLGLSDRWVPTCPNDHLEVPIRVLSRTHGDPNFLRPQKDSPLATSGAGVSDISLPAYVGAVPPDGVQPWDWQKTWDIQCRQLLTVSKDPAAGGHFRTITEALDKVKPGMTIRVLDDAVYEECLLITAQHHEVVLEAAGKATIRRLPGSRQAVWIRGARNFVLRDFRIEVGPVQPPHALVTISDVCPGLILDGLDLNRGEKSNCIELYSNATGTSDFPIKIQNCTIREGGDAIVVEGRDRGKLDQPVPCGFVVIRNNTITRCWGGVVLRGAAHHIIVAGNRIGDQKYGAIDLDDPLTGARDILIVNNTLFRCGARAAGVWDDHDKGKQFLKCKNIHFQSNLILEPGNVVDLIFHDHRGGDYDAHKPGDLKSLLRSREWHFSHNWREQLPLQPDSPDLSIWIPPGPEDHLQVPIEGVPRTRNDPNFLRPAKDSPLAWSGAGGHTIPAARVASAVGQAAGPAHPWMAGWAVVQTRNPPDRSLPAYVGAVPPEGVEPWDWDKTWSALTR